MVRPQGRPRRWNDVAERLSEARKASGLTRQQAGDAVGVNARMVYFWETGRSRPDMDRLVKVAELYAHSIDWILTGKEGQTLTDFERQLVVAARRVPVGFRSMLLPLIRATYEQGDQ